MPGGGSRGVPASGGGHCAGGRECSARAACHRRRRLARRPGYMRSIPGPGIRFLPAVADTTFCVPGGVSGEESHHSASGAGHCALGLSGQCQGPSSKCPACKSSPAPTVVSVGHLNQAQTSVSRASGAPVHFGIQLRTGTRLMDRLCSSGDTGLRQERLSVDSGKTPVTSQDTACNGGAGGAHATDSSAPAEASGHHCRVQRGLFTPPAPSGPHEAFASRFSFIQLSLSSAGKHGEAERCPPSREAECPHESCANIGAVPSSSDRPHGDPGYLSGSFYPAATRGSTDLAQEEGSSLCPEWDLLSSLDLDAGSSLGPTLPGCCGDRGCNSGDAHGWDALLRRCEPVLHDCLQSGLRQLEATTLKLKLQKLQQKAIGDDDYDQAEMLRQRLEDLEQERGHLAVVLPSLQPAISSFLGYLVTQAQATLHRATQPAGSDCVPAPLGSQCQAPEPMVQGSLHEAHARRDSLLQEKQQLQKEVEALQERMSALEAKDQQLRREIEEQERELQWEHCGLGTLVAQLPRDQLQEVTEALRDTMASANQIPFHAEPPEAVRSLRERIKVLNLSLKEITSKVSMGEKLCSTLRRRVSDLETQLLALLEAKMLAISGSHFCMAKDLTEQIRTLTSEREGLEPILGRLWALRSRTAGELASVVEDYSRLAQELQHQETVHKANVKENTVKYMEMLEGKLLSCKCLLLGRVWEADLEACRLLVQSLTIEDEQQMDGTGAAAWMATLASPSRPSSEDGRKSPVQASHGCSAPLTTCAPCRRGEWKQESYILSAELGEKCEAIGKKILHLEDQLHTAIHSRDEDLIQSLKGQLQMVKETLQAMFLQLQPAKEVGGGEAGAAAQQLHPGKYSPEGAREGDGLCVTRMDSLVADVPSLIMETEPRVSQQEAGPFYSLE
ncbi:disrupted in schizophrenia 1 protein [Octodon degus]|uniref:Disrupted in schizophrenia 1 protein n=1 Tax=Octodon degus TaxID=10160 RepID=A0A6P6D983_OCTDE|nr:disrupted in schizophrenia 1 protein [Octodon degus]